MKIVKYLKEMEYLKFYILAAFVPVVLFYSVYFYLDDTLIQLITDEDKLFEWWTVLFFLGAFVVSLILLIRTRNLFFLLFCLAFIFAAGEEVSWGQRMIGFGTPEFFMEKNVQKEFSIHNLEIFNQVDLNNEPKTGFARLLEMNFLFRAGILTYGILLPLLVFHFSFAQKIAKKIKLPIPPISIGFFFFINWMVFRLLHTSLPSYPGGGTEIFECLGAYNLFLICLFFLYERKKFDYFGSDIKDSMEYYPSEEAIPMVLKSILGK